MSLSHGPDDSAREPAQPSPPVSAQEPFRDASRNPSLELTRHAAVFLPADPPRAGLIAFWSADGDVLPGPEDLATGTRPDTWTDSDTAVVSWSGCARVDGADITVVDEETLRPVTVPARVLSVRDALPLLAHARFSDTAAPASAFWGAASLLALDLVSRGLLLPGLTPGGVDAWRAGPLGPGELAGLRTLAASMPPEAHAVPLTSDEPPLLPEPEALLRAFTDAVADTLPRTPAAPLAAGGSAFAADAPQSIPGQRAWAADVAAVYDAGVRLSLRLELPGFTAESEKAPDFRAVLQLHDVADPNLVADAAEVWAGSGRTAAAFGPRARMDALLALRRAARAWPPLAPLLTAAVPDTVELADEEVAELLGTAGPALAAAGVQVHWPRELADRLTASAVIGPVGDPPPEGQHTAGGAGAVDGSWSGTEGLRSGAEETGVAAFGSGDGAEEARPSSTLLPSSPPTPCSASTGASPSAIRS